MPVLDAETPESADTGDATPDSATLSEADLALAEALQLRPRAPWKQIASAVGVDATTAARRWHRLSSAGLAWLTAYLTTPALVLGYVDLSCRPNALGRLTEELCGWRCVFSLERTTGRYQLSFGVDARDLHSLDSLLSNELATLDGVLASRVSVATRLYRDGADWLVRALSPGQRAVLERSNADTRPVGSAQWHGIDLALIRALGADARRGCADLARECGLSESAVRRRVGKILRSGEVDFRCDFAHIIAGWPVIAGYRINVPAHRIDEAARALTLLPETRFCASVAGEHNLMLSAWMRAPAECGEFEARLTSHFPEIRVVERSIVLHIPKRMGRLLDQRGRAIGRVPMVAAA